jgi:hypothetical protein
MQQQMSIAQQVADRAGVEWPDESDWGRYDRAMESVSTDVCGASWMSAPPGKGAAGVAHSKMPLWVFDALDVDVYGAYRDIATYFKRFGFLTHARAGDFIQRVLQPNVVQCVNVRRRRGAGGRNHAHSAAAAAAAARAAAVDDVDVAADDVDAAADDVDAAVDDVDAAADDVDAAVDDVDAALDGVDAAVDDVDAAADVLNFGHLLPLSPPLPTMET